MDAMSKQSREIHRPPHTLPTQVHRMNSVICRSILLLEQKMLAHSISKHEFTRSRLELLVAVLYGYITEIQTLLYDRKSSHYTEWVRNLTMPLNTGIHIIYKTTFLILTSCKILLEFLLYIRYSNGLPSSTSRIFHGQFSLWISNISLSYWKKALGYFLGFVFFSKMLYTMAFKVQDMIEWKNINFLTCFSLCNTSLTVFFLNSKQQGI